MYFLTYSPPYTQNSKKNPQKTFSQYFLEISNFFEKKMSKNDFFDEKKSKNAKKLVEIRKFHFLIISLESYKKDI